MPSATCSPGCPPPRSAATKPGRFSFNVKGGRCEKCEGDGLIKIEMHFLPPVYVTCEACNGRRYNRETLEITYKGKNIADVLDMTVDEAVDVLPRRAADLRAAAHAGGSRPGLHPAWASRRRRSAAAKRSA